MVLDVDPKQVKALAAKDQPCGGSGGSSSVSNDGGNAGPKSITARTKEKGKVADNEKAREAGKDRKSLKRPKSLKGRSARRWWRCRAGAHRCAV